MGFWLPGVELTIGKRRPSRKRFRAISEIHRERMVVLETGKKHFSYVQAL